MMRQISKLLLQKKNPRFTEVGSRFFFNTNNLLTDLYTAALKYSQFFSTSDLEDIQRARLYELLTVAHALPFYQNLFQSAHRHEAVVTKTDMRVAIEAGLCVNRHLKNYQIPQHTSGSTGIPFYFFLDKTMLPMRRAMYRRMLQWVGKTKMDTVILLMPRQHPGLEKENIFFFCDGPQDIEDKKEEIFRLFEGKSVILQTRASHLRRLIQLLEAEKKKFRFKAVISYTEQLLPTLRNHAEAVLGAPVFDYYASNEITAIAQECERHDGLHVNAEWLKLEIVDANGKRCADGERGDIVVTSFANEVMPFIRYKLGDKGYFLKQPCACERTLPRLIIEGREESSFPLLDGTTGHVGTLMAPIIAQCKNIFQYQVQRNAIDDFILRIVPSPLFGQRDKKIILDHCTRFFGNQVRIALVLTNKISVHKNEKETNFVNRATHNKSR